MHWIISAISFKEKLYRQAIQTFQRFPFETGHLDKRSWTEKNSGFKKRYER